jgi:hypothetical protein
MQDLEMESPLFSPELRFRIAVREALVKLQGARVHTPSIAAAGQLADIIRDLHALLASVEPSPIPPPQR